MKVFEHMAADELVNLIRSESGSDTSSRNFKLFYLSLVEYLNPENEVDEYTVKIGLKIFREYGKKSIF